MKHFYQLLLISGLLINGTVFSSIDPVFAEETDSTEAQGFVTPATINRIMTPGSSISIERQVTIQIDDILETTTVAPDKLDVLFLADNTHSMGPAIQNVQDNAEVLLNTLANTYNDLEVGVARYYGDPQEQIGHWEETGETVNYDYEYTYLEFDTCYNSQGEAWDCYKYAVQRTNVDTGDIHNWTGSYSESTYLNWGSFHTASYTEEISNYSSSDLGADNAYHLQTPVAGGTKDDAITAINEWAASSGGDWAEGSFFALHQAASSGADINGYATGDITNWRDDAMKIIVWFGDAQSHTKTVELQQAISALQEQDIRVVAIHTHSTEKSYEQGLDYDSQASTIANSNNGAFASVFSSDLADTMVSMIGDSAVETVTISPKIDLSFSSVGDTNGLNITYSCSDFLGCDNVGDGDVRQFTMEITSTNSGKYYFQTLVNNVLNAEADNNINVVYVD